MFRIINRMRKGDIVENPSVEELLADAREVYGVFGKAQRALGIVDRALEREPKNIEALNLKAAILYELDEDEEAAAYHLRALELEPCSVEALHGLAALANDHEDYAKALELADRGIDCIPRDPGTEFNENEDYRQRLIAELLSEKAFALWYTGHRDEAKALLTEEGPSQCPLEVETFEDQLDWLERHPEGPEEE
jgi:tetratricopeptide (TPR) repeat protein